MIHSAIENTLFISDLDGTLLDDCSRVSPRSRQILNSLIRRGVMFSVATARTPATVQPLLKGIIPSVPAVVMTGAALWDREKCRYLNSRLMPDDTAAKVLEICRRRGINPFVYTLHDNSRLVVWHNGPRSRAEEKFVDERRDLPLKRFILDSPEGLRPFIPSTILMFAIGPKDSIFRAADEIRANVDCSVSSYVDIFGVDTGILEVFATGVSKAEAVTRLKESVGADRLIVFGDNLNDIPMMEAADEAYAVEGALPEVKAIATGVIGRNTADAVPEMIARLSSGMCI